MKSGELVSKDVHIMQKDSINALLNLTRMIERPHDVLPSQCGPHLATPRLKPRGRDGVPCPEFMMPYSAEVDFQCRHLKQRA